MGTRVDPGRRREEVDRLAMLKHFGYADEREVHYRRAGHGPPLILLHPAPGSSFALEPLIQRLAVDRTVIALDTPGAGESADLGLSAPACRDYSDALAETLDWLGLNQVDLYGSHTGATLALDFAHRNPGRVNRLILNALGLHTSEERADLLANYAPTLEPRWDGSHLVKTWSMRRDMLMFWPWYRRTPESRRVADMPYADGLHDKVVDMLRAGPLYWQPYHATFRYDPAEALASLSMPTMLTSAPGDPLAGHLDRSPDSAAAGVAISRRRTDDRDELVGMIRTFLTGSRLPYAPPPTPTTLAGRRYPAWLRIDFGRADAGAAQSGRGTPAPPPPSLAAWFQRGT